MERTQVLSWCYGNDEDCQRDAREFFDKLRSGRAEGKVFPFNCPYEVNLLHNREAVESLIAIQVFMWDTGDDSIEQAETLQKWCEDCGVTGAQERLGKPGDWNWKSSYDCLDNFSIFDAPLGVLGTK